MPAQRADVFFHHPVVIAVLLSRRQRDGAPEAEVDVRLSWLQRVQGPGFAVAEPQRAHPYRGHANVPLEELEELLTAVHRDLDVLDDHFALRESPVLVEHGGQAVLPVEGDKLAVDV